MNARVLIALAIAGLFSIGAVTVVWVIVQRETAATGGPDGKSQREHRERFFGGDTERDVRGGQEMKPRW